MTTEPIRGLIGGARVDGGAGSFEVRHGEFFTVLGPSGSGKTTTLRTIAGFEEPEVCRNARTSVHRVIHFMED